VVEDGLAVSAQPHVALQPGGSEAKRQPERLEGVLLGMGPGATVGEADRGLAQRGEPGGHDGPFCQRGSSRPGVRPMISEARNTTVRDGRSWRRSSRRAARTAEMSSWA